MSTLKDKLLARVQKAEHGCWDWTGFKDREGRGRFYVRGRQQFAYRIAYEEWVGPIPEGLVLDHLCQNPTCINPKHLEPVTAGENTTRHFNSLTHCRKGHPWDEENTGYQKRGRLCRACRRESQRAWDRKRAAEHRAAEGSE